MVDRAIDHPWPLLIQGGESFSWFPGARQRTGMNDCSEVAVVGAALVAAPGQPQGLPLRASTADHKIGGPRYLLMGSGLYPIAFRKGFGISFHKASGTHDKPSNKGFRATGTGGQPGRTSAWQG